MNEHATRRPRVALMSTDVTALRRLAVALGAAGFDVDDSIDRLADLARGHVDADVVVVDLDVAGDDGVRLFDRACATQSYVLAISVSNDPHVRAAALRAGADDVVDAGTGVDEITERCAALMRRPRTLRTGWDPAAASMLHLGPVVVDVLRREIRVHSTEVAATRTEFLLFEQLCRRPTDVHHRARLVDVVWPRECEVAPHVVDVHLSNLRKKLQRYGPGLRFFETVRGVGFKLSADLLHAAAASAEQLRRAS